MGQGVPRLVEHGERRLRVEVEQVGGRRAPDRRVQPPRHDDRRPRVRRGLVGGELPPLADPLERRLVDERGGGGDVPLVPLEHLRRLDDEVAPEDVVAERRAPADGDAVPGDVAQPRQQRADEGETGDLPGSARSHGLRVVRARRVPDEQVVGPAGDLVGHLEERLEDVVGAAQRLGAPRQPPTGQVRVDPPQPGPVQVGLEAGLRLAVVDARAVQDEHGPPGSVLDVVDHRVARADLHRGRVSAVPGGLWQHCHRSSLRPRRPS